MPFSQTECLKKIIYGVWGRRVYGGMGDHREGSTSDFYCWRSFESYCLVGLICFFLYGRKTFVADRQKTPMNLYLFHHHHYDDRGGHRCQAGSIRPTLRDLAVLARRHLRSQLSLATVALQR